jgi:hypothetical protein
MHDAGHESLGGDGIEIGDLIDPQIALAQLRREIRDERSARGSGREVDRLFDEPVRQQVIRNRIGGGGDGDGRDGAVIELDDHLAVGNVIKAGRVSVPDETLHARAEEGVAL